MSTNLRFPNPKDPRDKAWYGIPFVGERLASVDACTVVDLGVVNQPVFGTQYQTPDDTVSSQILQASQLQISSDNTTVMMWLEFGEPRHGYTIEVEVTLADGITKLIRSVVLFVNGL